MNSDEIFRVSTFWILEQPFVLVLVGLNAAAIVALVVGLGMHPAVLDPLLSPLRRGHKGFLLFWATGVLVLTGLVWWHSFSDASMLQEALATGRTEVVTGKVRIGREWVRGHDLVVVHIGSHAFPMDSGLPQPGLNDPGVLREGAIVRVEYFRVRGREQIVRVRGFDFPSVWSE